MIYVATLSPRRIELLDKFGFDYKLIKPCEEKLSLNSVDNLAIQKALSKIQCLYIDSVLVAFDTIVMLKEKIFEKPKNIEQAKSILESLSGGYHTVISAFVIKRKSTTKTYVEKTHVKFSKLSQDDIDFLVSKENVFDKAGSYAIQGYAAFFIEKIIGDYYNVVGLPLNKFRRSLLDDFQLKENNIFR